MKHNSTYSALFTETPADAKLFDTWLDERESEREINELAADDEPATVNGARLAATCGSYDPKIEPGQIRILSKRYTNEPEAIPYVAVLEEWESGNWLVAPFSPYRTPATPGEMTTNINLCGLGVIQAWNARTVQTEVLSKSFLFGQLDEKVRSEAAALFRNQLASTKLPDDFSALRGPAIIMEADPRYDYQAEAIARLQPLSAAVHAQERLKTIDFASIRPTFASKIGSLGEIWRPRYGEADYALAAADRELPQTEVFTVKETELSVTYSPEDQKTTFTFYDRDDEPDSAYDGYGLVGAGEFLGTFRNGTLRVPSARVKDWYQIVDREGREVVLAKK